MPAPSAHRRLELALLLALSTTNVATELGGSGKTWVVLAGVVAWATYGVSRWRRDPAVLREWGFRVDTLRPAGRAALAFTVPVLLASCAYGAAAGHLPPPRGFWLVLAAYPAWGVAQQLLLNGFLARNLDTLLPAAAATPLAAALFSLSHAPDWTVVALTFPAGLAWVWMYRRWPNLWVQGIAHGILGTAVFYLVLGRDPLAPLLGP